MATEGTPASFWGGISDLASELSAMISPATLAASRVAVRPRPALKGTLPGVDPVYRFDGPAMAAYESARVKLAAAAADGRDAVLTGDERRSLVVFQALAASVLANDGAIAWVPERESDVRDARAKGGPDALPDLKRGVLVADVVGRTSKDPTVARALSYMRGSIATLRRAPAVVAPNETDIANVSFDGSGADRQATIKLGSGQVLRTVTLSSPDYVNTIAEGAAGPTLILGLTGLAVVAGLGLYKLASNEDVQMARLSKQEAFDAAKTNALSQALLVEQQIANKQGRPVDPRILDAFLNLGNTPPPSDPSWIGSALTLGAGAVLGVGALWIAAVFQRGLRRQASK